MHTVKKTTEVLVITNKGIVLEANVEKTKDMVMSRDQNAVQNSILKISNKSFEGVEQFKCLGTTLTNQNFIHEELRAD